MRAAALQALLACNPGHKTTLTLAIDAQAAVNSKLGFAEPAGIPGRPDRPVIVPALKVKRRPLTSEAGRAALIHSLAHIEFNAINLALDIMWRFNGMPDAFYTDWLKVAHDEARHFGLLEQHLQSLGYRYGDFPAHDGLWDVAHRTKDDLLARLALVPRTLEARGLDASPLVRAKLAGAGDHAAAKIIDIILADEIHHVSTGNTWYGYVCNARSLDPIAEYRRLARHYRAPTLRGPFNFAARRAAGFTEAELQALQEDQDAVTKTAQAAINNVT